MVHKTFEMQVYLEALRGAGAELYEVGGPVRDRIMGKTPKDHDILCRKLTVNQITKILSQFGKVATVGKAFGVIKFSPHRNPQIEIDIALPRVEKSTGTGHRDFDVDFDPEIPVEKDLGRRDFTMNAMAMSIPDEKVIDPFGGQKDINERLLRMVFSDAFKEDPLRLVRAVQFAARFSLKIEEKTWKAMCEGAELIKSVSPERISQELIKLMSAPRPSVGFNMMYDCGLLKYILPELFAIKGISQDKQPGDDVYAHTMRVLDAARADAHVENKGDLALMFAALLHDTGKSRTEKNHPTENKVVFFGHQIASARMARKWMQRMKLSSCGVDVDEVVHLIENHMFETKSSYTDRAIRRFIAKIGKDVIHKLLDLRLSDNRGGKHPNGIKGVQKLKKRIEDEMAKKPPFGPKDLAINGNDIMELGMPEGPLVGQILKRLVELVLDDPSMNERNKLLAYSRELLENPSKISETETARKEEDI